MSSNTTTTTRHGWPRSAPPKLRCEAPSKNQQNEIVAEKSKASVPYIFPRNKTVSNAEEEQMQVRKTPRYSLNGEFPIRRDDPLKTKISRVSLPATMLSANINCDRRAVLIGVTYFGTKGVSFRSNSITHVLDLFRLLTETLKFRKDNVWVLTDVPEKVTGCPIKLGATRRNILTSLKWLVSSSKSGDNLFFGFSGIGGTVTKMSHVRDNEIISEDCFLPSDYPESSPIPESELSSLFARELHIHASLTAVLDSRDAAKVLRLPYIQSVQCTSKSRFVITETLENDQGQFECGKRGGIGTITPYKRMKEECNHRRRKTAVEERDILASAFSKSGKVVAFGFAGISEQKQKILRSKRMPTGALTQAFVNCVSQCISEDKEFTYQSVLLDMGLAVPFKRNSQLPQITSSHRLDICTTLALLGNKRSCHI